MAIYWYLPLQVRSGCGGTRYRLAVDEMPDTRDVIDLCEGGP